MQHGAGVSLLPEQIWQSFLFCYRFNCTVQSCCSWGVCVFSLHQRLWAGCIASNAGVRRLTPGYIALSIQHISSAQLPSCASTSGQLLTCGNWFAVAEISRMHMVSASKLPALLISCTAALLVLCFAQIVAEATELVCLRVIAGPGAFLQHRC